MSPLSDFTSLHEIRFLKKKNNNNVPNKQEISIVFIIKINNRRSNEQKKIHTLTHILNKRGKINSHTSAIKYNSK